MSLAVRFLLLTSALAVATCAALMLAGNPSTGRAAVDPDDVICLDVAGNIKAKPKQRVVRPSRVRRFLVSIDSGGLLCRIRFKICARAQKPLVVGECKVRYVAGDEVKRAWMPVMAPSWTRPGKKRVRFILALDPYDNGAGFRVINRTRVDLKVRK